MTGREATPADDTVPPSIHPEELHRYFEVLHRPTGQAFWILNGRARYTVTGPGIGEYRMDPEGDGVLLSSAVHTHPWGWVAPLADLQPLPGGAGMYAGPDIAPPSMTSTVARLHSTTPIAAYDPDSARCRAYGPCYFADEAGLRFWLDQRDKGDVVIYDLDRTTGEWTVR